MRTSIVSALTPMVDRLQQRSTLSAEEVDALLGLPVRRASLDAGTYVVREGDIPESFCVLLSGWTCRHKTVPDGSRQILAIQFKGDLLGLNHGLLSPIDHSVQTLSSADVALVPHQALLDLAAAHANIGRALWRETLVEASVAREWIVNLGQRDARERIAHLLCELVVRQEIAPDAEGFTVDWPLTQEQLGDATGLSAVHVNRTIQGMRGSGLIRMARQAVTILDWTGLQDVGSFSRAYLHLPQAVDAGTGREPRPT